MLILFLTKLMIYKYMIFFYLSQLVSSTILSHVLNLINSGLLCDSSVSLSPPPEEDTVSITRMVTSSLSSIAALASHSALGVQDLPHPDTPQGCKEAFQK